MNTRNDTPRLRKSTPHTHTLKLLLWYYFKENNVMRHLYVLNLMCSHRNMRFLTKMLQRSGLFVRVWPTNGRTFLRVWYACMWYLACSRVWQDMTSAHVKMKCEKWYISCLLPSWNRMLLLCGIVTSSYQDSKRLNLEGIK